ncbi:MAG: class I SAM-dependent methyltransferase, partial [Acetobacteraceae bacterium]
MLERMLAGFIREGRLVVLAGRKRLVFGTPEEGRAPIIISLRNQLTLLRIALNPGLKFGEAYMDGTLVLEQGTLADLFALCGRNLRHRARRRGALVAAFRAVARRLQQHNPIGAARRHVAHHYDLSETLFRLFLDSDLNYSCAYFARPDTDID